jgi:hypothetical protein
MIEVREKSIALQSNSQYIAAVKRDRRFGSEYQSIVG